MSDEDKKISGMISELRNQLREVTLCQQLLLFFLSSNLNRFDILLHLVVLHILITLGKRGAGLYGDP